MTKDPENFRMIIRLDNDGGLYGYEYQEYSEEEQAFVTVESIEKNNENEYILKSNNNGRESSKTLNGGAEQAVEEINKQFSGYAKTSSGYQRLHNGEIGLYTQDKDGIVLNKVSLGEYISTTRSILEAEGIKLPELRNSYEININRNDNGEIDFIEVGLATNGTVKDVTTYTFKEIERHNQDNSFMIKRNGYSQDKDGTIRKSSQNLNYPMENLEKDLLKLNYREINSQLMKVQIYDPKSDGKVKNLGDLINETNKMLEGKEPIKIGSNDMGEAIEGIKANEREVGDNQSALALMERNNTSLLLS